MHALVAGLEPANVVRDETSEYLDQIVASIRIYVADTANVPVQVSFFHEGGEHVLIGARAMAIHQCARTEERSEEHTSELHSLMPISYAVFCLKKHKQTIHKQQTNIQTLT